MTTIILYNILAMLVVSLALLRVNKFINWGIPTVACLVLGFLYPFGVILILSICITYSIFFYEEKIENGLQATNDFLNKEIKWKR